MFFFSEKYTFLYYRVGAMATATLLIVSSLLEDRQLLLHSGRLDKDILTIPTKFYRCQSVMLLGRR